MQNYSYKNIDFKEWYIYHFSNFLFKSTFIKYNVGNSQNKSNLQYTIQSNTYSSDIKFEYRAIDNTNIFQKVNLEFEKWVFVNKNTYNTYIKWIIKWYLAHWVSPYFCFICGFFEYIIIKNKVFIFWRRHTSYNFFYVEFVLTLHNKIHKSNTPEIFLYLTNIIILTAREFENKLNFSLLPVSPENKIKK